MLCVFVALLFHPAIADPGADSVKSSDITFHWALISPSPEGFEIGWAFENRSQKRVTFDYQIAGGSEWIAGRLSLRPAEQKMGGWLFATDRINPAVITEVGTD